MRRKTLCAAVFAAAFLFLAGGCAAGLAEKVPLWGMTVMAEAGSQGPISMEVTCGYGDAVKRDHYAPVNVTLENTAGQAFKGTLRIQTAESDFDVYRYSFPVTVKADSKERHVYNIPLGVKSDQLYVTLEDDAGAQVLSKRVKLGETEDLAELYIGLLSDHPESLRFLDGVVFYNSALRTRTLAMDRENFPEDPLGLDMIDVILVGGYKVNLLSGGQMEALQQWVDDGGTLIIGTGDRVSDNLGSMGGRFFTMPYPEAAETEVDMGAEYAMNFPGDSRITIPCVDITGIDDGSEIMSSDDQVLMTRVWEGKGSVILAAYDFSDIGAFCSQYPSYVGKIFESVFSESHLDGLVQDRYYGFSNQYWYAQSMVSSGNVERLPNLPAYAAVIIAYVVFVGPGLYFLLKRRDRQSAYVGGVVAAALAVTAVVYFMGAGTRFKDKFFNYASIREFSDETVTDTVYVSVQAPYNRPYTAAFSSEYTVRPMTRSRLYEDVSLPRIEDAGSFQVDIQAGNGDTLVSMQDVRSFDQKLFELTRTKKAEAGDESGGLTASVVRDGSTLTGTVTNRGEKTAESAALLLYGKLVRFGDIPAGATVELEGKETVIYPLSYSYAAAQIASGLDAYEAADIGDGEYLNAQKRSNLLDFYMGQEGGGDSGGARLIWFEEDGGGEEFLADDGYERSGIEACSMEVSLEESRGRVTRPVYDRTPRVLGGSYSSGYNVMQGVDPLILEYSLGTDIQVESLLFETVSDRFKDPEKYPYLTVFQGAMAFYNYGTNAYDTMDAGKDEFSYKELEHYLSPDNKIRVRYIPDGSGGNGWDVALPFLSVTGRT